MRRELSLMLGGREGEGGRGDDRSTIVTSRGGRDEGSGTEVAKGV